MARDGAAFLGTNETNTAATLFALVAVSANQKQQLKGAQTKQIPVVAEKKGNEEKQLAKEPVAVEVKSSPLKKPIVSAAQVPTVEVAKPVSAAEETVPATKTQDTATQKVPSKPRKNDEPGQSPGSLTTIVGVTLAAGIVALALLFGRKSKK